MLRYKVSEIESRKAEQTLQGKLYFGDRTRSHRRLRSRVVSQTRSLFRSIHGSIYTMTLFLIPWLFEVSDILYYRVCLSLESKKLRDITQICPFCTTNLDSIGVSTKKRTGLFSVALEYEKPPAGLHRFPSDVYITQRPRLDEGHLLIADRHQNETCQVRRIPIPRYLLQTGK